MHTYTYLSKRREPERERENLFVYFLLSWEC